MSIKLLLMMTLVNLSMMMINHPLSMALTLIIYTTTIALTTGMAMQNFWYSYMLFMIMIGGMLVLIMYMTSIASNEKFNMKYSMIMMTVILVATIMMMSELMLTEIETSSNSIMEIENMNESYSLTKFINTPLNSVTIMMINYLLVTLIAIVKITNFKYGSLRQKF